MLGLLRLSVYFVWFQIQLVDANGAIDGISITMPSATCQLQMDDLIMIDSKAVKCSLAGLAAGEMVDRFFEMMVRTATLLQQST